MSSNNENYNNKTSNYDEIEEDKYERLARETQEMQFKTYERVKQIKENGKLVASLENDFLVSCCRKFAIYSYLLNLTGILSYLYAKTLGIKRWKRFVVLTPILLAGNAYLLIFWTHFYPLKQYDRGLVNIQPRKIENFENKLV